jgi:hypothetical protein
MVDERYVQNSGRASAAKYQRRHDHIRINLTKASGL